MFGLATDNSSLFRVAAAYGNSKYSDQVYDQGSHAMMLKQAYSVAKLVDTMVRMRLPDGCLDPEDLGDSLVTLFQSPEARSSVAGAIIELTATAGHEDKLEAATFAGGIVTAFYEGKGETGGECGHRWAVAQLRPLIEPKLQSSGADMEWGELAPLLNAVTVDDVRLAVSSGDAEPLLWRLAAGPASSAKKWAVRKIRPLLEPELEIHGMVCPCELKKQLHTPPTMYCSVVLLVSTPHASWLSECGYVYTGLG